ncbi:sensor histidine kinase [Catenovulum sp. SM1970]|uniref:sensor histidine kinase n=1 Tax=Marinifaba aquimaris TaxID=2741323 RepID=UPI001571F1F8|nr:sensor histidine kinase [Marinifaba aquimaris]NTS78648.1 sensor histidine kinase [Marinifaba aquimaris]
MKFEYENNSIITCFCSWLATCIVCIARPNEPETLSLQLVLHGIMAVLIALTINHAHNKHDVWLRPVCILGQLFTLMALLYLTGEDIVLIYSVMLLAQLPYFYSGKILFLYIPFVMFYYAAVEHYQWGKAWDFLSPMVWGTFHLFAYMVTVHAIKAQRAEEKTNQMNQELIATQALVKQTTEQQERLRLARELHDSVGHQLTAMTIKLDVARRSIGEQTHSQLDELYQLSKDLLDDVRQVVSDNRLQTGLDIKQALLELTQATPKIQCHLHIEAGFELHNANLAHLILRSTQEALSNALKHSSADTVNIHLEKKPSHIVLVINDNGQNKSASFNMGNGLTGLHERVAEVDGNLTIEANHTGFEIRISLPHE